MKVKKVSYSRLKSLPNYQHEKVECEIELDEKDSPDLAVKAAKNFVMKQLGMLPDTKVLKGAQDILNEFGESDQLCLQLEPSDN